MSIIDNPRRLARLLASLNVPGYDRPLSPVEVANEINVMRDDLGGDIKEAIKRLPISADVVKEFLQLIKLPPEIQDVVTWGESSKLDGSIGFSVAAKISRLKNNDDILKLAGTILDMSRPVTKEEVKGVLSLKRRIPNKPIDDCIEEVLNVTRRTTIHYFLFISRIEPSIAAAVAKSGPGGDNQDKVSSMLKDSFPPEALKNVKVVNDRIRLVLEKEGWEFIASYAERHHLLRQDVVTHMLESAGFTNDV